MGCSHDKPQSRGQKLGAKVHNTSNLTRNTAATAPEITNFGLSACHFVYSSTRSINLTTCFVIHHKLLPSPHHRAKDTMSSQVPDDAVGGDNRRSNDRPWSDVANVHEVSNDEFYRRLDEIMSPYPPPPDEVSPFPGFPQISNTDASQTNLPYTTPGSSIDPNLRSAQPLTTDAAHAAIQQLQDAAALHDADITTQAATQAAAAAAAAQAARQAEKTKRVAQACDACSQRKVKVEIGLSSLLVHCLIWISATRAAPARTAPISKSNALATVNAVVAAPQTASKNAWRVTNARVPSTISTSALLQLSLPIHSHSIPAPRRQQI